MNLLLAPIWIPQVLYSSIPGIYIGVGGVMTLLCSSGMLLFLGGLEIGAGALLLSVRILSGRR